MSDIYITTDKKHIYSKSTIISPTSIKFSTTKIICMALVDNFVDCFRKLYTDGELESGKPYIVQFGEDLDGFPFSRDIDSIDGIRATITVALQPVEKNVQAY